MGGPLDVSRNTLGETSGYRRDWQGDTDPMSDKSMGLLISCSLCLGLKATALALVPGVGWVLSRRFPDPRALG